MKTLKWLAIKIGKILPWALIIALSASTGYLYNQQQEYYKKQQAHREDTLKAIEILSKRIGSLEDNLSVTVSAVDSLIAAPQETYKPQPLDLSSLPKVNVSPTPSYQPPSNEDYLQQMRLEKMEKNIKDLEWKQRELEHKQRYGDDPLWWVK